MLTLTIEITGSQFGDLDLALMQVKKQVGQECLSGADSNDTGEYTFTIVGEEEESGSDDGE